MFYFIGKFHFFIGSAQLWPWWQWCYTELGYCDGGRSDGSRNASIATTSKTIVKLNNRDCNGILRY